MSYVTYPQIAARRDYGFNTTKFETVGFNCWLVVMTINADSNYYGCKA